MSQIHLVKEYFIATILLSIIHGAIPNHWLPFVVISKAYNWNFKTLSIISIMGGFFHSLSTALLGIFISYLGFYSTLNLKELEKFLSTFFIVILGMIYIIHPTHEHNETIKLRQESIWISILLLYLSMFFSPCLEIEAIYFSIGKYGIQIVILISILYTILSIFSMLFFIFISFYGYNKYYPKFLEKYEKKIVGIILIMLGIISFYY